MEKGHGITQLLIPPVCAANDEMGRPPEDHPDGAPARRARAKEGGLSQNPVVRENWAALYMASKLCGTRQQVTEAAYEALCMFNSECEDLNVNGHL